MRRDSIHWKTRKEIKERSDNMCEAMKRNNNGIYSRCWMYPIEIHHLLTKARGGDLLDKVDETYHLIALCKGCHAASDGGEAYAGGLLIEGYVTWNKIKNRPVYIGPDLYLTQQYPPERVKETV